MQFFRVGSLVREIPLAAILGATDFRLSDRPVTMRVALFRC